MRTIQLLCYSILLGILVQACDNNDSGKQVPSPETSHDIKVKVMNLNQQPLDMVVISLFNGNLASPIDTTKINGTATLPEVIDSNKYSFQKNGYIAPLIRFDAIDNLDSLYVFLTNSFNNRDTTLLTGVVNNALNNKIYNARVESGIHYTYSDTNGIYSLWVPTGIKSNNYPISYIKDGVTAKIEVDAKQDTVAVDVYIDGFSIDTVNVKEK